jgi:hypothetical protein
MDRGKRENLISHLILSGRKTSLLEREGPYGNISLYQRWIESSEMGNNLIYQINKHSKICNLIQNTEVSIRLSQIADYGGKTRIVSIGTQTIQLVLREYHRYLMKILRSIPEDCS